MKKQKANFIEVICFILLITVASLLLFTRVLPSCGVNFSGKVWQKTIQVLEIVQNLALILLACVGAFGFVRKKAKAWLILYVVAVIICALSVALPLF